MAQFSFANLDLAPGAKPPAEDVGLPIYDAENSGLNSGDNDRSLLLKFITDPSDKQAIERQEKAKEHSVNKKSASMYLWGCCFYNCCCCCCSRWFGPWCGTKFMASWCICFQIDLRRDRWLSLLHLLCFALHTMWATLSWTAGAGKPMEVQLYRVRPTWQSTGRNGYTYQVVESDWAPRIDTVTGMFFLLSAIAHGMWIFVGPWSWSKPILWSMLDKAICWWRWLEYSLSASLMLVAIALITALRQVDVMVGIFFLCFTTMWCGFVTEIHSRPKLEGYDDNNKPIYNYDYWEGQPKAPERSDQVDTDKDARREYQKLWNTYMGDRIRNYLWRLTPHILGFFPYGAAWALVLGHFWSQIYDLPEEIRDRIPWFVAPAVIGTFIIFSTFTFVQIRYQWTAPRFYWRSEVWYTILSLTAKSYLGGLLYSNVLLAASFDEAVSLGNTTSTTTGR